MASVVQGKTLKALQACEHTGQQSHVSVSHFQFFGGRIQAWLSNTFLTECSVLFLLAVNYK